MKITDENIRKIDAQGCDLQLCARTISYIADAITDETENDIEQMDAPLAELTIHYHKLQALGYLLIEQAAKLRSIEQTINEALDASAE